jgi:alpha-ketoglutarate-dependent taurine dioxygenase
VPGAVNVEPHPLAHCLIRTFTALALSDDLRLDFKLQPGDIGLVNNLTMLHAKTAFKVDRQGTLPLDHLRLLSPLLSALLQTYPAVEINSS